MANQYLSRHPAHQAKSARPSRTPLPYRSQVQLNLEVIRSALCSQSLLLRFDKSAAGRLLDIAGEIESVSDQIEGGCHE